MTSHFIMNLRLVDTYTPNSLPTISTSSAGSELRFRRPSLLGNIGAPLRDGSEPYAWEIDDQDEGALEMEGRVIENGEAWLS